MEKRPYLVDVPVRVNIWARPQCQRAQFEVLRKACPSIMILQSDGGRNEKEWEAIRQNRKIFDEEIDWECQIYKLYEESNQGLYAMGRKVIEFIWERFDRCIFLEDDYVPAVSFFQYCAELLERYKDDQRIGMITGNNVFTTYPAAEPYDYFFSEEGWSIWGTATWRDRALLGRKYPLPYADNVYIKKCLKSNLPAFWFKKVKGYCSGELVDGHYPGGEYYQATNSVLFHRVNIIPTKNLICNIGTDGTHAHIKSKKDKDSAFFNLPTFELEFPLRHPEYIIDDKDFGRMYSQKLGHPQTEWELYWMRAKAAIKMLFNGKLFETIKRKRANVASEK